MYVTPAHQFVLGGRLSVGRRCDLLGWARSTGGLIIEDDYDGEFRYDAPPLPALRSMPGAADHVVYLGTMSKVLTPQVRLGWAVLPDALVEPVTAAVRRRGLSVDGITAQAVARLISSGALIRHQARAARHHAGRRAALTDALARHLPDLEVLGVDAGLHVVRALPPAVDDTVVGARLLTRGVQVGTLSGYCRQATGSGLVIGYARLPAGSADEVVALIADVVRRTIRPGQR